jgi:hypothetical protein
LYGSFYEGDQMLGTNARLRFLAKVKVGPDCWLWMGAVNSRGYGAFCENGTTSAHRFSYSQWGRFAGSMGSERTLDHLCRNRACVNPAHLEPVSCRENLLRGETLAAANAKKTRCVNGHLLRAAYAPGKHRRCHECHRDEQARYKANR